MARNTPRPPAPRIPASAWWNAVTSQLVPIANAIKLAKRAEHRDLGHECGHEFTITSTVRGHSWVVGGLRHWSGNPDVKQWAWRARAALEELREAMHDVVADDIARAEQPRRLM